MKAAWYRRQGPAQEVIEVGEMPSSPVGAGEVRVRLACSGLNPSDIKRRKGFNGQPHAFPLIIPNSDGAGVVAELGPGVQRLAVGDRVWVYSAQWKRPHGTNAEEVVLPVQLVQPLPQRVSMAYGACVGIPALTAHRALFADGPIVGQTVLVQGGAGAVGHCAIQMARWGGAKVIATVSSAAKAESARLAGADHVINYQKEDVSAQVMQITQGEGVHRIIEVAFGQNLPITQQVLRPHGVISCYASDAQPTPVLPFYAFMMKNQTLRWVFMYELQPDALLSALSDICLWLSGAGARGTPRPIVEHVDRVFALEETAQAHDYLDSGQAGANVVIRVSDIT
ncbi:MAG: NADPH:quinone reductase [Alphaproteobacteria bacterium]|nr:NADPH:quinone reductase [Alphaproteobacteria bacterium]